jgi:hypothetical protein
MKDVTLNQKSYTPYGIVKESGQYYTVPYHRLLVQNSVYTFTTPTIALNAEYLSGSVHTFTLRFNNTSTAIRLIGRCGDLTNGSSISGTWAFSTGFGTQTDVESLNTIGSFAVGTQIIAGTFTQSSETDCRIFLYLIEEF